MKTADKTVDEEFEKKYINKIIHGNNLEIMKGMPDNCIDFVMTSPPYWSLRSYGKEAEMIWGGDENCEHNFGKKIEGKKLRGTHTGTRKEVFSEIHLPPSSYCNKCNAWKGELGLEPSFHDYIRHLLIITDEIKRILKPTGSFYLNIGDTYFGSSRGNTIENDEEWERRGFSIKRHRQGGTAVSTPKATIQDYNSKCMCGIPERIMLGMIDQGWILRNKNIWYKPNSMPSSVRDRLNNTYEVIYHFVKSNKKQYWVNSKTMQLVTKQPPTPSTGKEGVDWDWKEATNTERREGRGSNDPKRINRNFMPISEKRKKVSNWRGWDYFYDLDAIRKPHQTQFNGRIGSTKKGVGDSRLATQEEMRSPGGKNPGDCICPYQDGVYGHYHNGKRHHPLGSNPGDFFKINTQPFSEAHFAVFPEAIVTNPLKSSCPKEVCTECGMPKVRITKPSKEYEKLLGKSWHPHIDDKARGQSGFGLGHRQGATANYNTLGYAQCSCGVDFKPGIAFDPFTGSGTTLLVAKKLGYRFIGTEIIKEYVIMAKKRLKINDYYMPDSLDDFKEKT